MMISKSEAAEALRDIEHVHRRASAGGAYAKASPHLLLGGMLWAIGYVACGILPAERWGLVWAPIGLAGAIASYVIALRAQRPVAGNPAASAIQAARILWLIVTTMAFIATSLLLFRPADPLVFLTFPGLVMAFVYALLGSLGLPRFRWIGAAMFALLILGLVVERQAMAFWIAAAGGGGLILGGLWLRRA